MGRTEGLHITARYCNNLVMNDPFFFARPHPDSAFNTVVNDCSRILLFYLGFTSGTHAFSLGWTLLDIDRISQTPVPSCCQQYGTEKGIKCKRYDIRRIRLIRGPTSSRIWPMLWQFPDSLLRSKQGIFGWWFVDEI